MAWKPKKEIALERRMGLLKRRPKTEIVLDPIIREIARVHGYEPIYQRPFFIEGTSRFYIVDWYIPVRDLVIEVDGPHHIRRRGEDAGRDEWLRTQGFEVMRIPQKDIEEKLDNVKKRLGRVISRQVKAKDFVPSSPRPEDYKKWCPLLKEQCVGEKCAFFQLAGCYFDYDLGALALLEIDAIRHQDELAGPEDVEPEKIADEEPENDEETLPPLEDRIRNLYPDATDEWIRIVRVSGDIKPFLRGILAKAKPINIDSGLVKIEVDGNFDHGFVIERGNLQAIEEACKQVFGAVPRVVVEKISSEK